MQNFNVTGMTCEHCARAVKNAVHSVDPGAAVEVDLDRGRVTLRDEVAPASRIIDAIAAEGYAAEPAGA